MSLHGHVELGEAKNNIKFHSPQTANRGKHAPTHYKVKTRFRS